MLQNGKTQEHMVSSHSLWPLLGVFKKICEVSLLDLMTNISVNNVYVKYIFIYPCSQSKLCRFHNSMIFPWVTDPKFNDFSMIFSFLQISRTFHEIQWFFHDLEIDLNFNDFSRAAGTLLMAPSHCLNQCWLLLSEILWHSLESNFAASGHTTILYNEFENYALKITAMSSLRGQWVNR